MPDTHACPLCEWSREAEHPTVLDPHCPRCGGVLEHRPAAEPREPVAVLPLGGLRRSRTFDRLVTAAVVLPLVLAAGKVGLTRAGPTGAAVALAIAALAAYVAIAPATRQR